VKRRLALPETGDPSIGHLIVDGLLGIAGCFGLVVATNAMFAGTWGLFAAGLAGAAGFGWWLIRRIL
jgi:hypothetical protein